MVRRPDWPARGAFANSTAAIRRVYGPDARRCAPERRRARPADQYRSSWPFMPPAELCRTVLDATDRLPEFEARRADIAQIPFGIVWLLTTPQGRRADDRSAGSGFVCQASTA